MNNAIKLVFVSMVVLLQAFAAHAAAPEKKPIAIVVEYTVADGKEQELLRILREHARTTIKEEPGCLRFEVLKPINDDGSPIPDRIMLTELYADEAAADTHAKSPRLAMVLAKVRPLLTNEKVTRTTVLVSPKR